MTDFTADTSKFYIDGAWVEPSGQATRDVINPATMESVAKVALGNETDADRAIAAAKAAFPAWSETSREERLGYLKAILAALIARNDELAAAIQAEMGAPTSVAQKQQAPSAIGHFMETIRVLEEFDFEEAMGTTLVRKEPIGVAVLITPWNWPLNQIACKVAPALAAGCTMVLKPSELAPLDAAIFADIVDKAGLPKGVFNLVHGEGPAIGNALTGHKDADMVSFTGSTRAGIAISANAANTIKRVALELGGKSANILLDDADFEKAVTNSVFTMMNNSGQSCNAPSRMMVPESRYETVKAIAAAVAEKVSVGRPEDDARIGPIANENQYKRVVSLIDGAKAEGAELITGGSDKPAGLEQGLFVQPTIFGKVTPDMTIAREEVFGPVLSIMTYTDVDEAIEIANSSEYGLSGYVWSGDADKARKVASRLRTGMVHINGAPLDNKAPFGGYKMSGNGREWGIYGLEEFLETKSVFGGAA